MPPLQSILCSRAFGFAGLALLVLLLLPAAFAGEPEIYTGRDGLAVGGYDTVAYFKAGEPVKGSADFTADYKGATWRFSSRQNLQDFEANPESYAPRYGGHCAWALAIGKLVKGNPKVWTIHEAALYFNVNKSTQKKWLKDVPGFIAKADKYWPGVLEN